MDANFVASVVGKYRGERGALISILEDIQSRCGYLPMAVLKMVSEQTGSSPVDVYGVATFYRAFSLKPRGKHLVSACVGTACHVRGGSDVAEEFEHQLDIRAGNTTADKEFTLETVNCLGACALGPTVVVDGHYFSNVNRTMVKEIIEKTRKGFDETRVDQDPRIFPVEVRCPRCNHTLMDAERMINAHPSIRITISFNQKHGWLRLSSLYGSRAIECEYDVPTDTVVNFFCPHCHAELVGASQCAECAAPMIPMIVEGGGIVQVCARRGCRGHMLDL